MDLRPIWRLLVALSVLSTPPGAVAQAAKVPVVGLLSSFSPSDAEVWHQAFRQGLRELGWTEGSNIRIEYRYAEGRSERLPRLAAELVALHVDMIVASTAADSLAAKQATTATPIVMAFAGDVLATGLVASLARPGGNITGLTQMTPELAGKRVELLREIVPRLSRLAVLWNPQGRTSRLSWNEMQAPARQLGVQLHSLPVRSATELDAALESAAAAGAQALVVMPDPLFVANRKRIAELAAKNRLPSMMHLREFAHAGGLAAYGPDRSAMFRRVATYVDKILKGAKPGDLPVEQPTKFELIINLRTASALGLRIPAAVLLQADKAIE